MSGKDPELSRLGEALSKAREAYTAAKKVTDVAKQHLNETGDCIQGFNTQINSLKEGVMREYNEMRASRSEGDREGSDEHRTLAQKMQEELTSLYDNKKTCFIELLLPLFNKLLKVPVFSDKRMSNPFKFITLLF